MLHILTHICLSLLCISTLAAQALAVTYEFEYKISSSLNTPSLKWADNNVGIFQYNLTGNKSKYWQSGSRKKDPHISSGSSTTRGVIIYKDLVGNSLYKQDTQDLGLVSRDTLIYEDKWSLVNGSSRIICGYDCQKATQNLAGSQLTAWFCMEIPLSDGPMDYYGLPGLILGLEMPLGNLTATKVDLSVPVPSIDIPKIDRYLTPAAFKKARQN
jgi:GLPGLI family protein